MAEEDEVGAAVEAGAEDGEQEEEYVPVLEQKLRLRYVRPNNSKPKA